MKRRWKIAQEDEILSGRTTDTYFERTVEVLNGENIDPIVHAEVTVSGIPQGFEWAFVAGINDALELFKDKSLNIGGLPEGTLFYPRDKSGIKVPVFTIEGHYSEFAVLETPMLGFICHTSGMVTKTTHIRLAAGDKDLLSFGARRTHPAITPQVEYAAYIGGCDGVSCVLGAELLDIEPSGTMPHALVISFEDQVKAWKAFDRHVAKNVPRIAIVDTYSDEVHEAVLAAENIPNLMGVRIDTTSSRRGSLRRIIQEVRWELDVRGFSDIKIFASGGLGIEELVSLQDVPVDGYGVGGAISNAPAIDFAMDIVSIKKDQKWMPAAKKGKFSGRKIVWRCEQCMDVRVTQEGNEAPICLNCDQKTVKLTTELVKGGKTMHRKKEPHEIREHVLKQLERVSLE